VSYELRAVRFSGRLAAAFFFSVRHWGEPTLSPGVVNQGLD
jgi:hypothetical protein